MTSSNPVAILALALVLGGCGGDSGNSSEAGISVAVDAQHRQIEAATGQALASPAGAKTVINSEGVSVSLELAYLNIWSVELADDCSGSSFSFDSGAGASFAGIIGQAHAHAETAPNRISLPHILSLLPADQTPIDMGAMQPPPGDYCGLIIDLQAADADTKFLPDDVSMLGRTLYLRGSYGAAGATAATAFEFATSRSLLPRQLLFDTALRLGADRRNARLSLAFEYDRWFDGLDLANLDDPVQITLLAQNIAASVRQLP